jgi:hypothetical protein
MASDSPSGLRDAAAHARRLAEALDAIEAELDRLELGASPDVVAKALAAPIRAFDAAAKEAF